MARYQIFASAYVNGTHTFASPQYPAILDLPDEVAPSRTWEPLDEAASRALGKLGVRKSAPVKPTAAPSSAAPTVAPRRPSDKEAL